MLDLKDGDYRLTVKCLTAGQPRPYANSIYTYQVYIEWIPYDTRVPQDQKKYEPCKWVQEIMIQYFKTIKHWKDNPEWHEDRLSYIKNIEPGLWEFKVISPYLD